MRRALLLAAALGWSVLAAAPAALAGHPPITRPITEHGMSPHQLGANLFAANCATCHGSRGQGVPVGAKAHGASNVDGAGPSLKDAGALAADFYLQTGYMPLYHPYDQPERARSPFHPREISALVGYVASLGKGPPLPSAGPGTGNVARGLHEFTDHCAGCHQVVSEGGIVTGARVPPLTQATPRQIREAVRIGPWVMPRFSAKQIDHRELEDIVSYVQYAQHPKDVGGWGIDHLGPFPEGMVTWFLALIPLVALCVLIGTRLRSSE